MSALGFAVTAGVVLAIAAVVSIILSLIFRRVVPTNMVHIVQSKLNTISYGTGQTKGNVYMDWPSSLPFIGVTVTKLPVSNFDLSLMDYAAYDKDRVPFMVDITAFFRIKDTNMAAQRVSTIEELKDQLTQIVQGAVRKTLASDVIDSIMLERSKFGEQFTQEVKAELAQWGVESVKSMELMDIRDAADSNVVNNIMAKKKSHIEMESRIEVAENMKAAEVKEIEARQATDIRDQEAKQAVGQRTAEKDQAVGIADEQAKQAIKEQAVVTAEKDMAVKRVEEVRQAEIEKDKQVVAAQQDKETTVIVADGQLAETQKEAEGIKAKGEANANAEMLMQMAPVEAKIALFKAISQSSEYLAYLAQIEAIEANQHVGMEQAKALQEADVKVISNAGSAGEGVTNVMDLFSSKGGANLGAAVEALAQTPMGDALMKRFGISVEQAKSLAETAVASKSPNGSAETEA